MRNRSFVIALYLLLARLSAPLYWIAQKRRLRHGKENRARQGERWGKASLARPENNSLVWFHAASVGETQSILGIVDQLLAQDKQTSVLITSTTVSSANLFVTRRLRYLLQARSLTRSRSIQKHVSVRRLFDIFMETCLHRHVSVCYCHTTPSGGPSSGSPCLSSFFEKFQVFERDFKFFLKDFKFF